MSGMRDCFEQMADQIRTTLDIDPGVLDVQVEPKMVLVPTPLTIDMYPGDLSRDPASAAFGDEGGYLFTVRARINTPDFDAAYDVLLSLMDDEDPFYLPGALYADPTLGGHATSLDARDQTGLRVFEHPGGEGVYLGFQFTLLVIPAKT